MSQVQRVFTTDELIAITQEPQPEGVIIADAVEEMWLREQEKEYSAADERRAITAGEAKIKQEAFEEVLREIYDRFGYAPRVWEVTLCRQ